MTASDSPALWPDADRAARFQQWLAPLVDRLGLRPDTLTLASSDASSRRYLRLRTADGGSLVVMDAPATPNQVRPFMEVAALMTGCGLHVPRLLAQDEDQGFVLMEDLGSLGYLEALRAAQVAQDMATASSLMRDATTALLRWQGCAAGASLPRFDEAFVRRELQIFVDWCVQAHHGKQWNERQLEQWNRTVALLVANITAQPMVPMHRDYMARNLMVCRSASPTSDDTAPTNIAPDAAAAPLNPGILDFQDAVLGPITYDLASLLRDAFLTWDEAEELDWAVRYWEGARSAGLFGIDPSTAAHADGPDPHPMAQDFGLFWRALEWTALQRHLKILGIFCRLKLRDGKPHYAEDLPRFYAYVVKTASRYMELTPLVRLMEDLQPQMMQTGFSLR
ncbi:aminoglycoside phosphotransferase family protein [Roseateles amylovorans]|uniref:Phosphotransferase n=1 Tax=Roseateles amylovorans TaxID=2978473 RepID=A0ABY6B4A3_9BURK|nr:phosphotransferase [Roseateles amylovorans]UXH78095.1 phosphotransferase [Roseateles amylovorans]